LASIAELVSQIGTVGIFQYMAWYVIFRLLGASDAKALGRWRDFLMAAGFCLLVFLPTNRMVWVAGAGTGVYLWLFSAGDPKLRSAGIVLVALSVQEFWGRVFFGLVAYPLLHAETAVIGTIMEATRAGTIWQDNLITGPSGYGIVIYSACSSFHNLSLAMLCWVTVTRLQHQNWQLRDYVSGAMVGGAMILLNFARLYLMALDGDLYQYFHDGMGAEVFAVVASLTILLLSLYRSRSTGRPA
jgi:hypothetical protein